MATEIEVKYLVETDGWIALREHPVQMTQAYLARSEKAEIRVRIAGDQAWITVKSAGGGMTRSEFEYQVPLSDAEAMARISVGSKIEKTRWQVAHTGHVWVVDEYHEQFEGLVLAELELDSEEQSFALPEWASRDVTHDAAYRNASLASEGLPGRGI